ncbi:cob(I)yrinic acid a,c-diamide adenosyltransferase [Bacteroidota bacterium]
MKIYTKTGDKGETSLLGGNRISKDHKRIDSYGSVDELNAVIGLARTEVLSDQVEQSLKKIQNNLFIVGADLASPLDNINSKKIERVNDLMISDLERLIDDFDEKLNELKNFILPGGTKSASLLHLARTICRRTERELVKLSKSVDIGDKLIVYLNRLSDLLFVLARYENLVNDTPDEFWNKL